MRGPLLLHSLQGMRRRRDKEVEEAVTESVVGKGGK